MTPARPGVAVGDARLRSIASTGTATPDEVRELAAHYLAGLDASRERIRRGMDLARDAGTHIGRPRVALDVERACALWADGMPLKAIARAMRCDRNTLRRRLVEAGVVTTDPMGVG